MNCHILEKRKRRTAIVGVILIFVIFAVMLVVKEPICQLIFYGLVTLFFVIYIIRFKNWLDEHTSDGKIVISDGDIMRSKTLKRLLIKEGIDANSPDSIRSMINVIEKRKEQIIPLKDIYRFIVLPFAVVVIPMGIVFFDHLTHQEDIFFQAQFLLTLVAVFLMFSISCFMIVDPIRWLIYRKYDEIIELLELLRATI